MRKKRIYRTTRRFIAILMAAIMLCMSPLSGLQMNTAYAASPSAAEIAAENAAWETADDEEVPYSPLVGELEEHRDRNTKTFLREDGAKEMIVYSYAVHYEDDGQWKDIDNSLYPVKMPDGSIAYTNVANDYRVWFSEGSDGDYLVKIEKDGYSISWTIPEMTSAAEALVDEDSISDIGTLADGQMVSTPGDVDIRLMTDGQLTTEEMSTMTDEERDNALKFPSSYSSVIAYESAVNGLDVRYVVRPQMIEEFFEASTASVAASLGEVELVISCEGVTAQKSADGSVMFVASNGEQVFSLGQPYMSDASGAVSADIDVSLTPAETAGAGELAAGTQAGMAESGEPGTAEPGDMPAVEPQAETAQYIYQLTPSKEWLESEERTYPVSVDPNIYTSVFCDDIQDASVYEQGPDFPFGTWPESLRVGWRNGGDTYRTYIKFNTLPAIEAGNVILSANLQLFRFWDPELWNHYDYGSAVEAYAVNAAWAEDTITWNNQPSCGPEVEAVVFCHPLETEGKRYQSFDLTSLVKRWYSGTPNYGISLRSAKEDEQYFYEYYYSEAEYGPENHPHLSIVYANAEGIEPMWSYHSFAVNRAGVGYVNDYTGSLTIIDENVSVSGGALPISISHVYNSNNRDVDVGYGLGWRLSLMEEVSAISVNGVTWYRYLDGDGTEHYYYPSGTSGVYLDEMDAKNKLTVGSSGYTLVNSSFITRTFNSDGYLTKISDPNGNTMTIELVGNWPVTVIDSAGRRTTLDYSSNRLAHIYYPDGSKADCYYTGSYLNQVRDADGCSGFYSYMDDAVVMVDSNKHQVWFDFDTTTWRVKAVRHVMEGTNTAGPSLTINYGWNVTSFTDQDGRTELVRFNHNGEPVSVQDATGRAAYGDYSDEDGMKGKLTNLSEMQKTSVNLLSNGDADSTSGWSLFKSDDAGTTSNGRSTSEGFMGSDSLYLTKSGGTGRLAYLQYFTPVVGKTYTFSAYLKGAEGAIIFVQTYNGSTWTVLGRQKALISSDEWNRTSVTATIPSGATNASVVVMLPDGSSGTLYADCLQLEEGELSRYNLLTNSDFANGTTSWTVSNTETGDGVGTIPSGGTHPSILDGNGYLLSGDLDKNKYVSQTVSISGSAGDSYVFGGWMKAASVPTIDEGDYGTFGQRQLKVIFMNGTTQVGEATANFSADTEDWQYLCSSATAPAAYTSIVFRFAYPKNCNTAWFDGLQLYKEGFGERYTYEDGNLTQVVDKEDKDTDYVYDSNDNVTSATDKYGDTVSYTYDGKHNVLTSTALKTKTTYTYDSKGNVTSTKVNGTENSAVYLQSSATYSSNGAFLESLTDALGNTARYTYNTSQGSVNTATDPVGNITAYGYDSIHRVNSVTAKKPSGTSVATVSYAYSGDYLTTITRNSMSYGLTVDPFGNTTAVTAAGNTLVSNTYEYSSNLLTKTTYGNGYTLNYTYDEYDRLKTVKEGSTTIYTAYYDGDGRLYRTTDGKTGITTQYDYDLSGKLVRAVNSDGTSYRYIYDGKDSLTGIKQTAGGRTWTTTYAYDAQYRPTKTIIGNSSGGTASTITSTYDTLSRLTKQVYDLTTDYTITLGYTAGANGGQSTQLASYKNGTETAYQYTYDANGNIKTITYDGKTVTYTYDSLNQMTREDNQFLNKSIVYTYDAGGNLSAKKEYAYTTGTLGTATATISYSYGNTWKDQLTSYNGQSISYDAIGNPTTYRGWTFGWSGRDLTSISNSGTTGTYTYNNDGLRTTKTVGGVTTSYTYQGSLLMAQQSTDKNLYFSYDSSGKAVSVNYNGTEYYYLRNGQGDIVGLLDGSGTKVVSYTYDSWGKLISTTGTLASTLGADNPLRYRGYYYDVETGYYWLTSRYYDPEVGRFINADAYASTGQGVIGFNMFAYCLNNPVNRADLSGNVSTKVRNLLGDKLYFQDEGIGGSTGRAAYGNSIAVGVGIGLGTAAALNLLEEDDIDWDIHDAGKNHVIHGTDGLHDEGWRKLGFEPDDNDVWKYLVPFMQKIVQDNISYGHEEVRSGIIRYYSQMFYEAGVEVVVKIWTSADGLLQKLSDAIPYLK